MPYKSIKKRRECNRRWAKNHPEKKKDKQLRETYGITLDDYILMLEKQNYKCAICGTNKSGDENNTFWVDHNHKTGKVRGLLCVSCNIILGAYEKIINNNLIDKIKLWQEK